MKLKVCCFAAALTAFLVALALSAFAGNIPVANYSFETLPTGGFNNFCGGSCAYTTGLPIPSWVTTGGTGQWTTGGYLGNPPAYDGTVLAYTNGGTISQDVIAAVAGEHYTLQVEILHRTDVPLTGLAQLTLSGVGVVATATGGNLGPGSWNLYTAHFTATPADAGKMLGILLSANSVQGDFDDVRLSVPERSNLAMMLGFGIFNLAAVLGVRRKLI